MMHKWYKISGTALLLAALGGPVRAQQTGQDQSQSQGQQPAPDQGTAPIPAYRSPLASAANNGDVDTDAQELTPDNRALSGVQALSIGMPTSRTYWQPHIDVSATADSNPNETANGSGWGAWASIYGGADVHWVNGNSNMTVSDLSGGLFSNDSTAPNGIVEGLNFAEQLSFRRWNLSFLDQLNYLPESSLGFGTLGGTTLGG